LPCLPCCVFPWSFYAFLFNTHVSYRVVVVVMITLSSIVETTVANQNDIHGGINSTLNLGNVCYSVSSEESYWSGCMDMKLGLPP
jgi:hypothetical protein